MTSLEKRLQEIEERNNGKFPGLYKYSRQDVSLLLEVVRIYREALEAHSDDDILNPTCMA